MNSVYPISLGIFFSLFFSLNSLAQQNFSGIYIKNFIVRDGRVNTFTKDKTKQYRIKLQQILDVKLVNRNNPEVLEALKQNEILLLENLDLKKDLPASTKKRLKEIGVSILVEGEVFAVPLQSITVFQVRYSNIFSREVLYESEVSLKDNKLQDRDFVKRKFQAIIPTKAQLGLTNQPGENHKKQLLINADFLKQKANPWPHFQGYYHEDFSDINSPTFDGHIWTIDSTKDYTSKVIHGKYQFDIIKHNLVRHKYINSKAINIKPRAQIMPFSITIAIDAKSKCLATNNALGRGLTVRYNTKKKSCYAFTLTDDGVLKFIKINNLYKPDQFQILFSTQRPIQKGQSYHLGIVCVHHTYYLYFNKKLIKIYRDTTYPNGYNGVFAHGKGIHAFDDVRIYESFYVE